MHKLLDTMDMSLQDFHYPLLENLTPMFMQLRDELLYNLRHAAENYTAMQRAEDIIRQLEGTGNFNETVNLQFILSCKITLRMAQDYCPDEVMTLIDEALYITYPEFDENNFEGDVLLFEEMNLLHAKAQIYKKDGKLQDAIKLLTHTLKGVDRLPSDDRDKEQKQAPIMLTLVECYMQEGDYAQALQICKEGCELSRKYNKSFNLPDFAGHMATCLMQIEETAEAASNARRAYFGYIMQRRNAKAAEFLQYADSKLGVKIKTYGTDTLQLPLSQPQFDYGSAFYYNKKRDEIEVDDLNSLMGNMIGVFRDDADLKPMQLCAGICSVDKFLKTENGERKGNVFELEALMWRLGRDIDKYFNTLPNYDDFMLKQKRDAANALIANGKFDEAKKIINELSADKKFTRFSVNRQFIASIRATFFKRDNPNSPEYFTMLQEALRITRPKFDIKDTAATRHTLYELVILNKMAIILCSAKETRNKGLRLFEDIIESMDVFYVDSGAKMRMYPMILLNYTSNLLRIGRLNDVMPLVEKGENMAILYSLNKDLPALAGNKAVYLMESKNQDKEKSLAYTAIAYYGSLLIERLRDANDCSEGAKDYFDVTFD